jgi:hypothetical protein
MQGKDPEKTSFMVAFLRKTFELSNPLTGNLLSIYRPLIRMVAANISLHKPQASQPQPSLTYGAYGAIRVQPVARKPALDGQLLASLLGYINDSEAFENGSLLVATVMVQASGMDPLDYEYTILPFLKGIIMRLLKGTTNSTCTTTCSRHVYQYTSSDALEKSLFRSTGQGIQ